MSDFYTQTSLACSQLITNRYSTSFSLGIRMLHPSVRLDVYAIYGFVRLADEIVDTYQDKNPSLELARFREETFRAIDSGISFNPVLQAFQATVNRFQIDRSYIEAFLHSMEMDLSPQNYDQKLYETYIYGSAEVVGLMCLRVFCQNNLSLFNELIQPARKLGSAFQKVNFLRDIKSDLEDRERVYFPGLNVKTFSLEDKRKIEAEIEEEFREAQLGINRLPENCRRGVQLALTYYRGLLKKIRNSEPQTLLEKRVRISNFHKIRLLIANLVDLTPAI
ncbi:MAG TPA: phytoene/squalene synthase family protein [Catalimonadaceae bacterium]|nr:phytoene/squalene synthase family protein [Catalimonadaceae bacterium]